MSNKIRQFSKNNPKEQDVFRELDELDVDPLDSLYGAFFESFDALSSMLYLFHKSNPDSKSSNVNFLEFRRALLVELTDAICEVDIDDNDNLEE